MHAITEAYQYIPKVINSDTFTKKQILSHSVKVFHVCQAVIDELSDKISPIQARNILSAALLHDIGKTTWPGDWFVKPRSAISDADWAVMCKHPIQGAIMLKSRHMSIETVRLVREHHERPNGKGYPCGTEPDTLVLILAACDVYSACTEDRAYRKKSLSKLEALDEVNKFAPIIIVDALHKAINEGLI